MIELLPEPAGKVVSLRASGEVSAEDYEQVVIPAVETALAQHGKVRVLYQLSSEFTGFTAGAMWDDMKLGLGHFHQWDKVAVVTDVEWVANAMRLFAFAMPCPVKVFGNAQFDAAAQWIVD